jgi:hypothetical protein
MSGGVFGSRGDVSAVVAMTAAACGGVIAVPNPGHPGPGATEVPPASLQVVSLDGIEVVDQAGAAVRDAEARARAEAFMRTYGFLTWAVSRGRDGFLQRSGLSSAPLAAFRPNLNDIAQAREAGARVEYTREVSRRIVLRPVPAGRQPAFRSQLYVWKPYALYLDAVGPAATVWVDGRGSRTVRSQVAAGAPMPELLGGELSHDPLMGDVWVLGSDWDCTAPSSRQGLAPACSSP